MDYRTDTYYPAVFNYLTGTVVIDWLSEYPAPYEEKENKEKEMSVSNRNTVVSAPYIFDTALGEMNVQFSYTPDYNLRLNDNSRKVVTRDITEALITNHPYNANSPVWIGSQGVAVRRPSENNNKTAARYYALLNAVKNGYKSRSQVKAVMVGYLRSCGLETDFCNLIIGNTL